MQLNFVLTDIKRELRAQSDFHLLATTSSDNVHDATPTQNIMLLGQHTHWDDLNNYCWLTTYLEELLCVYVYVCVLNKPF